MIARRTRPDQRQQPDGRLAPDELHREPPADRLARIRAAIAAAERAGDPDLARRLREQLDEESE